MTREEAIAIIENEKKCVNRANKNDYCNRDCYNCELVKTDTEILTALDMAIKALKQEPCEDCVSRDAIRLKIAEMPKYTDGKKLASIRHLEDFLRKEIEEPIEVTPDICIGFTMALECIGKFVKNLPPVTPKLKTGHWIPVSERLPEDEQEILFSTKTGRVHSGKYHDDDSANQWYSHRDKCRAWNNVVSAWMPLPEPYKEESEDEE